MSNYIYYNGELYHFGVKGMRWGQRKRQAREEYNKEVDERRKAIRNKADELYKTTKEYKHFKDDPDANPDWYDGIDDPKERKLIDKVGDLHSRANRLDRTYAKGQAVGSAYISTLTMAPVAMYITAKATKNKIKNARARSLAILGAGLGTVGITTLNSYIGSKKEHKKAVKAEGIKSVRERLKSSK